MAKKFEKTKQHSGIDGAELEEVIQALPVRIMACTLSPFKMRSMRSVYESYNLYLSEIPRDLSYLMMMRVIEFERKYSSYSHSMQYDNVCFQPHTLLTILHGIPKEETNGILSWIANQEECYTWQIDRKRIDIVLPFVRALLAFNQDDDWQSLMPECVVVTQMPEFCADPYLMDVLTAMLDDEELIPFIVALPPIITSQLRSLKTESFASMTTLDAEQKFRLLFFGKDNQPLSEFNSAVYVLQNELVVKGRIDQLLEKYCYWPFMSQLLAAIKALHDGNSKPMIVMAQTMETQFGAFAFKVPIITMWLCAALLMSKLKEATALAQKLNKKRDLKKEAELLHALLEYKLNGEISPSTLGALSKCETFTVSQHLCFSLFALHYQMFTKATLPPYVELCEDNMIDSNLRYMQMLYAAESDKLAGRADELQNATSMKPFFPKVVRKEDWELKLDRLIEKTSRRETSNAKVSRNVYTSDSRIVYLLSSPHHNVQPILQKTSNNGSTWTKGRNIALRTFMDENVEGMTAIDRAVSKKVEFYSSYWSGMVYELCGNDVIAALAGHPLLFTNDEHRLKIDITLEPLQVSVTNDNNKGFTIKTNVDVNAISKGYFVDWGNKTSWRVVKVDNDQLELIKQFSTIGTLPVKAKDKLSKLMSNVSHSMTVMSDLLNVPTEAKMLKASPLTVVQLVPEGDSIRVSLFVKPLTDVPPYLVPGKGIVNISGKIGGKVVQTRRNLKAETQNLCAVEAAMHAYDDREIGSNVWLLDVEQTLTLLDKLGGMKEQACVEWPEGVKMKVVRQQIVPTDLHLNVHKLSDWFTVDGEVQIDENTQLKMSQLLKLINEAHGRFIRLGEQEFVALSQDLAKYLRNLARLNTDDKQVRISSFSASLIDELEQAGVEVEADKAYRSLLKRITEAGTMTVKTPKGIQADLRDYQKEGFQWLSRLAHWGAGACLADDMGLGKTLQSISILFAKRSEGASLVVAPASVLQNWQDEIDRFAPSLHTIVLNKNGDERAEVVNKAAANDVVITTYGLLVTEQELLASKQWNVTVLDEAHTIKNRDTKMSKAAMTLQSSARIALTGTPLQNRLAEIWNIFQFLNPGLLGSYQQFSDNFITPIEKNEDRERQRLLKRVISPFMLRRTKTDVLSELPQKTEITVKVNLSNEERALYENLRQQAMIAVENGECNAIQALAELTRLRQAACNAQLIDKRLNISSSKAETFMQLVGNLHDNYHRALVFSQFTSHLALIRHQLDEAGINYLYLDGSTPVKQRAALVSEFQTGDAPLFLISLKAGGLGLNLTAADYVIHLDPWWNPAIEDQASDRSYRIGQQKPVTVYRLIATNTIEEKILSMHQYKKSLADALLEGSDLSARMTREEILELLHEMK